MELSNFNNCYTDKNTTHSYLNLYEKLFKNKKNIAKNVLEVGIHRGGSIKLWHDYFTNATIYGVDIQDVIDDNTNIKKLSRIKLFTSNNAYDKTFVKKTFLDQNIEFDMILDDGPHTLESMKTFINLYSQVLSKDGILVIEDVQDINWLKHLEQEVPPHLKQYIEIYDLRYIKNRYDDIVFVINKTT